MDTGALVAFAAQQLLAAADPAKAGPMAAYMKTDMPFYGVQKAGRVPIVRALVRTFPPADRSGYEASIRALWCLDHREEKYLALGYARAFEAHIDAASVPLHRELIVTGAWWDLVDETAIKLVGVALRKDRDRLSSIVRRWSTDDDLWLRRTSIICQVGSKAETDTELLAHTCTANMGDRDFFIRKAIGWALRDHARNDAEWVRAFVDEHRDRLSPLSVREASKHL
jgi:3-methyladenine DNA glycosylase AlkD